MKKSIFFAFTLAAALMLVLIVPIAVGVGRLFVSELYESTGAVIIYLVMAVIFGVVTTALVAFLFTYWLSGRIGGQIEKLTYEGTAEEEKAIWDEFRTISDKISVQTRTISKKSNELSFRKTELSAITDNMSEGMLIIGSDAEILSYNKAAQSILSSGSALPKSITLVDLGQSFRNAVAGALAGKNQALMIKLGEKYYSFIINPVIHENIVEGAVIVILDETEKESREALRREFTSNISHELKTPLTSISGFAELIESGMADGGDEKRFAGKIYREAQRLIVLVGDIIRLTQLDGGEIPFDESAPDILEIAKNVCDRLDNVAEKCGVTIKVTGNSTKIRGNTRILEEMIYNLADNGIKYNNPGGEVLLSVYSKDGKAYFSCKDNGIGIPEDRKERVFERFYRVDKSHSREIGGTGLGLSIVKHGAVYHGATITLETQLGEGTNITICFPKNEEGGNISI